MPAKSDAERIADLEKRIGDLEGEIYLLELRIRQELEKTFRQLLEPRISRLESRTRHPHVCGGPPEDSYL